MLFVHGDTPPANWEPCSPALLHSGVDCASAPRWGSAPIGEHWHPPAGWRPLIAYQVGDTDIVAAYSPEQAIEVLCSVNDADPSDYSLDDVKLVPDSILDSLDAYDPDEGEHVALETTMRQDITILAEPSYVHGWE